MNAIEKKFNELTNVAGILDKNLRNVAEMYFYSGASYALKEEPVKLCALVCPGGFTGVDAFYTIVEKTVPGVESIKKLQSKESDGFTQQELQFLSYVLRTILNEMENHTYRCNRAINHYWENSIPDDDGPESKDNFKSLNLYKDAKRELKMKSKRMANLQRKIKSKLRK